MYEKNHVEKTVTVQIFPLTIVDTSFAENYAKNYTEM